ncbi:MAG: NAD(P)/FAD-dependent oxidoreductase [Deltaproteobacteria bacterium]|nr:NAD(P)/FAD-dependent oxidoreductase [Deltaproteobacteria bacterium]
MEEVVIIGGGPAGLTAAWELDKLGRQDAQVFEKDGIVGGIARTDVYKDYRFDIGGHRFFTKVTIVEDIWNEILGDELLTRPRLSRIFYKSTFFDYPLKPLNALGGLGLVESARVGFSFLYAQVFPIRDERTFDQWVTNRFGRRLFEIFFETYTEKVWGIPCSEIGADWAAQRIKNLDLVQAVKAAVFGQRAKNKGEVITTLIEQFQYPRLGPGQMWESCRDQLAEKGIPTHMDTEVVRLERDGTHIVAAIVHDAAGERRVPGGHFISSMPIRQLVGAMDPPAPPEVQAAAASLKYRDFLTVVLIVKDPELFPDNWIYIHSPEVRLGRIQNFKNWSPEMVPDPSTSALGLEYFVNVGDDLWSMDDADLVALGTKECDLLGLVDGSKVIDGCVVRMPKAYPVYDQDYQTTLDVLRGWLDPIDNLQLIGRNGQHRYNNQDHSMLTAVYAARNIAAQGRYDLWSVNVEEEYHEEVRGSEAAGATGDRMLPQRVEEPAAVAILRRAYARYDTVALGAAVSVVGALALFVLTAVPVARGVVVEGMILSSLAAYLPGYSVSWAGAVFGAAAGALGGFAFGWVLATAINAFVRWHGMALLRRLEHLAALDPDHGASP